MNNPNALDPNTGTCLHQHDTATQDETKQEFFALLGTIVRLEDKELLHTMRLHTAQVKQASLDDLLQYRTTRKKPSFDFMQRKTKRILKEVQHDAGL